MNKVLIAATAIVLAACGSKPPQPDWKTNASSGLKAYSQAYFKGDNAAAQAEFARARNELASTGRPDLAAHAELYRCATELAALDMNDCPGFAQLAQDASAREHAYAAYLAGRWEGLNVGLLPEQHRAVVQGKGALASIADPLSQLVAAGVLMKTGRITPADIAAVTATASAQGWRRPLLAWLGVAQRRALSAGDAAEAARIERRIALAAGQK